MPISYENMKPIIELARQMMPHVTDDFVCVTIWNDEIVVHVEDKPDFITGEYVSCTDGIRTHNKAKHEGIAYVWIEEDIK